MKLKTMQQIHESWKITDTVANQLKSEFVNYYKNLNPSKSAHNSLITYDLFGTSITHHGILSFSDYDLDAVRSEVEDFKENLNHLKEELDKASVFSHNSFYNSYYLLLDRFWSNIKILSEILAFNKQQNRPITYTKSDLMLNNLDFQNDDSILDNTSFQFDLRSDQLSTPRNKQKLTCDKACATIEEKSSQTECFETDLLSHQSNNLEELNDKSKVSKSLDSGYLCSINNQTEANLLTPLLPSEDKNIDSYTQSSPGDILEFKKIDVRMNLKRYEQSEYLI